MKFSTVVIFIFLLSATIAAQDSVRMAIPLFTSFAAHRVALNASYKFIINAKDSAGSTLIFSAPQLPQWLRFNGKNIIYGKAKKAGQYPVQIQVSNGQTAGKQQFMLTVYDKQTTNILCLGNSITNGTLHYNSYRRALWQLLHQGKYNVDFIGSWDRHHMGGDVPDPDFDMDHEGHSGWRFDEVFNPPSWDSSRGSLNKWLGVYTPGMVLVELGTNDVFQCRKTGDMLKDLDRIITAVRKNNRQVKIFLAQIPPLGREWAQKKLCGDSTAYEQAVLELNASLVGFAKRYTNSHSPVIIVDQFTGVNTDTDMYDDIHPNEAGEKRMAENWFRSIRPYLNKLKN